MSNWHLHSLTCKFFFIHHSGSLRNEAIYQNFSKPLRQNVWYPTIHITRRVNVPRHFSLQVLRGIIHPGQPRRSKVGFRKNAACLYIMEISPSVGKMLVSSLSKSQNYTRQCQIGQPRTISDAVHFTGWEKKSDIRLSTHTHPFPSPSRYDRKETFQQKSDLNWEPSEAGTE